MRLRSILLTSLLFLNLALAQTCYPELRGLLTDAELGQVATGNDAAHFLHEAVDLLEPVLPPLVSVNMFGLQPGDAGFEDADFLAQRGLLPAAWQADTLTTATWQEMLDDVAAWYDLEPFATGPDLTRGALLETLSNLIDAASPRLNPVALVATDPADRDVVAFWGIIRSDSVYPRLIVYRPPNAGVDLAGGVGAVLPRLETCALRLDNYVYAAATTAQKLFLATNQARMYVATTAPQNATGFIPVPVGDETDYLTFQNAALTPYTSFAALFDGPSVGPGALLRLLPQVRNNMNPREVLRLIAP
ncbi:hypothetical protein BH24DEI2_BH24DEI2_12650 [soil metagenome]